MAAIQARYNQFNTMAHPLNRPLFLRRVPGFGDQLVFRLSPTIHFTLSLLIAPRSDGMAVDANANLRAAASDRAAPQTPVAQRGRHTGPAAGRASRGRAGDRRGIRIASAEFRAWGGTGEGARGAMATARSRPALEGVKGPRVAEGNGADRPATAARMGDQGREGGDR